MAPTLRFTNQSGEVMFCIAAYILVRLQKNAFRNFGWKRKTTHNAHEEEKKKIKKDDHAFSPLETPWFPGWTMLVLLGMREICYLLVACQAYLATKAACPLF